MSGRIICIECGISDGFHYSQCSMWSATLKRKRRLGEKVGDAVEEILDTLVDFVTDLLKG